jgi:hypothetical protein
MQRCRADDIGGYKTSDLQYVQPTVFAHEAVRLKSKTMRVTQRTRRQDIPHKQPK